MNAVAWVLIFLILLSSCAIGYMLVKSIRDTPPPSGDSAGPPTGSPGENPMHPPGFGPFPSPISKNDTYSLQDLHEQLIKPTSSDSSGKKRGVLAHMVSLDDVVNWIDLSDFSLNANDDPIVDCGVPLRTTCSAWTYLRTDLFPCIYIRPSANAEGEYATALCGILVDADKIFDSDMITSMSILDSNTDTRGCCFNDSDGAMFLPQVSYTDPQKPPPQPRTPCNDTWASNVNCYSIPKMWEGYAKEGVCDQNCNNLSPSETKVCKANLSGGGLQQKNLGCIGCDFKNGRSDNPEVIANWGSAFCDNYAKGTSDQKYNDWLKNGGCDLCKYNNFCYLSSTAPDGATELPRAPNQWSTFVVDTGNYNAGNLIGEDASGLERTYLFKDPTDAQKTLLNTTFDTAQINCRFRPDDWDTWIKALLTYYKAWFEHYEVKNSDGAPPVYNMRLIQPWDSYCTVFQNYTLAHPQGAIYLENEVNLYMYPQNAPAVEDKAAKQSDAFRDAIVGFFYVGKTCLKFMEDLKQTETQFAWYPHDKIKCTGGPAEDPKIYKNAVDRCLGFYCEDWRTESVPEGSSCQADFVDGEELYIGYSSYLISKLTQKFNAKYRTNKKQAGAFKYTGQSNVFFHYPTLKKLVSNGSLQPAEFFSDSDFPSTASDSNLLSSRYSDLKIAKGGINKNIGRPVFPKGSDRTNLMKNRAPMIPK